MKKIVVIEKSGECKNINIKSANLIEISKKCGFRKLDHFEKRISWKINYNSNSLIVAVYAKNNGRANSENKFDMPPPIDNELYFGSLAVVAYKDKIDETNTIDFSVDDWCKVYEKLMGGFINLEEESETESESEEIPKEEMSKEGYHKDGFIVDSEEEELEEPEDENAKENEEESDSFVSEEESYNEYTENSEQSVSESEEEQNELEEENIGSELEEEEYLTE